MIGRNRRRQRGVTLLETLISLGLLIVVVVSVLSAFSATAIATARHRQAATLDLLVRSDAEFIKSKPYVANAGTNGYGNLAAAGYTFSYQVLYENQATGTFSAANADTGLQEAVLTVSATGGGTEQLDFLKVKP